MRIQLTTWRSLSQDYVYIYILFFAFFAFEENKRYEMNHQVHFVDRSNPHSELIKGFVGASHAWVEDVAGLVLEGIGDQGGDELRWQLLLHI